MILFLNVSVLVSYKLLYLQSLPCYYCNEPRRLTFPLYIYLLYSRSTQFIPVNSPYSENLGNKYNYYIIFNGKHSDSKAIPHSPGSHPNGIRKKMTQ